MGTTSKTRIPAKAGARKSNRPEAYPLDRAALYRIVRQLDTVDVRFTYLKELPEERLIAVHYEVLSPVEKTPVNHGFPCYCMWGQVIARYYPYDCCYSARVFYMTMPEDWSYSLGQVA